MGVGRARWNETSPPREAVSPPSRSELLRDAFRGPDAEFCVFVADLAAIAVGGRREGRLRLLHAVERDHDRARLRRLAVDRDVLAAAREIFAAAGPDRIAGD